MTLRTQSQLPSEQIFQWKHWNEFASMFMFKLEMITIRF